MFIRAPDPASTSFGHVSEGKSRWRRHVPLLAGTAVVCVEAVGHESVHASGIDPRLEATGGEVTLDSSGDVSRDVPHKGPWQTLSELRGAELGPMAYLVLDIGVTPRWGHILRHCGG